MHTSISGATKVGVGEGFSVAVGVEVIVGTSDGVGVDVAVCVGDGLSVIVEEGVGELGEGGFGDKTKTYAATALGTSMQSKMTAIHSFLISRQV
jgi:hypothetical protein